jgi:hypothetical protein
LAIRIWADSRAQSANRLDEPGFSLAFASPRREHPVVNHEPNALRPTLFLLVVVGCGSTDRIDQRDVGVHADGGPVDVGPDIPQDAGALDGSDAETADAADAGTWTCDPFFLGDGECDCGCNVPDSDCTGIGCTAPGCCNETDCASLGCAFCWGGVDGGVVCP